MATQGIEVGRLTQYSYEDAAGIGRLMPFLTSQATGQAIPREVLQSIINSPDREQFIAKLHGRIVGSAVLNIITGNLHQKAWLEDFVTDPAVRGQGAGRKIWDDMLEWCQQRGVGRMEFTSNPSRLDAHIFYTHHGAEVKDTIVFEIDIPSEAEKR